MSGALRFKPLLYSVVLLAAGAAAGHLWGRYASTGGGNSPAQERSGTTSRATAASPCVHINVEGIRDRIGADLHSAIAAKRPGWGVSSSMEPGNCEPGHYLQVVAEPFTMSQRDWNTEYETSGYAGAMAINTVGRPEKLALATGVFSNYDTLLENISNDAVEFVEKLRPDHRQRASVEIVQDGKSCVKLTSENEYTDDDEARRLLEATRRWYVVGGPARHDCQPDAYVARNRSVISTGDRTVGHVVAFTMLTNQAVPSLSIAWAPTSNQAGSRAIATLLQNVPAQIDPSAN